MASDQQLAARPLLATQRRLTPRVLPDAVRLPVPTQLPCVRLCFGGVTGHRTPEPGGLAFCISPASVRPGMTPGVARAVVAEGKPNLDLRMIRIPRCVQDTADRGQDGFVDV